VRGLVTGGAGFIGSHVVGRLVSEGWETTVLDDLSTGARGTVPVGVPIIELDVADAATASAIARLRPEVVVHCAAQVSVARSMEDPAEDWRVNVLGTQRVIDGARAAGARVVFLSSGGAIYGNTDGADEDALPAPMSYYAVHKYVAERYLALSGVPYAIARLANAYGPGQRAGLEGGVVAILAQALAAGAPVTIHGTGDQRRDFVHVDDIVRAITLMAAHPASGTWNVGTGQTVSIRELLRELEGVYGQATAVSFTSRRAGDVDTSRLIVNRARDELGWTPIIDLMTGLTKL
jgi:UDP-glucose 4-epimerase